MQPVTSGLVVEKQCRDKVIKGALCSMTHLCMELLEPHILVKPCDAGQLVVADPEDLQIHLHM